MSDDEFVGGFCSDLEEEFEKVPLALDVGDHLKTSVEWADLGLSKPVLKALVEQGYKNPTPIQRDAIPEAIKGMDVLGMAETGSGKTLAFVLPAVERLLHSPLVSRRRFNQKTGEIKATPGSSAIKVLILLPTRELADQCFRTIEKVCKYVPLTRCLLKGSTSTKESEAQMRLQPDIVVSTPGRCLDILLNCSTVHMDLLDIVVFDEADRLLDMGFKAECLSVLKQCSPTRQTLLFSATLTAQAKELAALALKRPIKIGVAEKEMKTARHIKQTFISVDDTDERLAALVRVLELETETNYDRRLIVFFNTKRHCHQSALLLQLMDVRLPPVVELHGDLPQHVRSENVRKFENKEVNILFATDVAARGLDLDDVQVVINCAVPSEHTRYVHRVGRTGRRGQYGEAVSIFHSGNEKEAMLKVYKELSGIPRKTPFKPLRLDQKTRDEMVAKVQDAKPRMKDLERLEHEEKAMDFLHHKAQIIDNKIKYQADIQQRTKRSWIDASDRFQKQRKIERKLLNKRALRSVAI